MIRNQKVKILWLSDIHFSACYPGLNRKDLILLRAFVDRFVEEVKTEHNGEEPIDYIFLTGDLAQSGAAADYHRLRDLLLDPLFAALTELGKGKPKVITIPGNHDLDWNNDAFLDDYIRHINTIKGKFPDRPLYLESRVRKFRNLFKAYTGFIAGEAKGPNADYYQLKKNKLFEVSAEYNRSRLFGHVIDKERKLVIILFNTAWFSLGDGFNQLYQKHLKKKFKYAKKPLTDEQVAEILQTKDILTEYNSQVTGIQLLKKEALEKFLLDYPDYVVVTAMHHSRNWLEWTESFTHNKKVKVNDSWELLKGIIRASNLILTGHEHVPIETERETFENVVYLKGGCFLEYNQLNRIKDENNFSNNWFSILTIDSAVKSVYQKKYFFNAGKRAWGVLEPKAPYDIAHNPSYILTEDRKQSTLSRFKKGSPDMLKDYLTEYFPESGGPNTVTLLFDNRKSFEFYLVQRPGQAEICILAKSTDPYFKVFQTAPFFKKLVAEVIVHKDVKCIRFLVMDLFVDGKLKEGYQTEGCNRGDIFNLIVKSADNLFDVVRHEFFMNWEPDVTKGKKIFTQDFTKFAGLMMVNQIIPYWVSERFWI